MKNAVLFLVFLFALQITSAQNPSIEYKKVSKNTEMISYYENGLVKEQGYFDAAGKLTGNWVKYDAAGKVLVQGVYSNGKKVGKWLFWEGNTLREVDFADNKLAKMNLWTREEYLASH
jgi:antitoxin component YwqK of YwqJK toxin-antitoxin module